MLAEAGNAKAQSELGHRYARGIGVAKNYEESFEWSMKAALQGDARAQNNVGVAYNNGDGVAYNVFDAYAWWYIAATSGDKNAQNNLVSHDRFYTEEEKEQARRLARHYQKQIRK